MARKRREISRIIHLTMVEHSDTFLLWKHQPSLRLRFTGRCGRPDVTPDVLLYGSKQLAGWYFLQFLNLFLVHRRHSMNLMEINERFTSDDSCREFLERLRWPAGVE